MKQIAATQGSPEWRRARLGIPTASNFDKVMMGRDTQTRQDYMCRLIMERILGRSLDENFRSKWMQHGVDREPEAVREFCATQNLAVETCGFFVDDDDNPRYGCSPDRIIKDRNALLEVKCPAPWTHCRYHVFGLGKNYKAQVQGQMLVTGADTVYFYSYFPGLCAFILETDRDEKYIKSLETELNNFCDELEQKLDYMSNQGKIDLELALDVLDTIIPEE